MIIFFIYIRLKYRFWSIQPVFHFYDFHYWIRKVGIISKELPEKNKFTNFHNITTFSTLSENQWKNITAFIQLNYLRNKNNIFYPKLKNIKNYFINHNHPFYWSFYEIKEMIQDGKNNNIIEKNNIIGLMSSRPLTCIINRDTKFRVYYADYLCLDKLNRKKGIAPQIIQTHEYNQRRINKNIVISLFKREDNLTGIVPLCLYSTYGFPVDKWTKPPELTGQYKLLEINATNYRFVYDFIRNNSNKFDIIITSDMANILELIKTKNIFVYAVLCDEQILCCYFFRKSCVQIEKGLEVLSFFASICHCEEDIFIQGFKISFWKIAAENFFGFAALENISHNNIIINNIMLKTKPLIISPTAYFFYNFAYPTFKSNKTLIIN